MGTQYTQFQQFALPDKSSPRDLPYWLGQLGSALDTKTVLYATSTTDRDTKYAWAPVGAVCISSTDGTMWVKTSAPGSSVWYVAASPPAGGGGGAIGAVQTAVATTDQLNSTTTPVDDNTLQVAISPGATYRLECTLYLLCQTTQNSVNFAINWNMRSAVYAQGPLRWVYPAASSTAGTPDNWPIYGGGVHWPATTIQVLNFNNSTWIPVTMSGILTGITVGDVINPTFAQWTSSATAVTRKAGSQVTLTRIA